MQKYSKKYGVMLLLLLSLAVSLVLSFTQYQTEPVVISESEKIIITPNYDLITTTDSIIWPAESTLQQGLRLYSYNLDPILNIHVALDVLGNAGQQLNLNTSINQTILLQSQAEDNQLFWEYVIEQLPIKNIRLTANQQVVLDSVTILPSSIKELIDQINLDLGINTGTVRLLVVTSIDYQATSADKTHQSTIINTLPLSFSNNGFFIDYPVAHKTTSNIFLATPPATVALIDLIIDDPLPAALTTLIILFIIIYLIANAQAAKAKVSHRKFKEWITEGSVITKDKTNISVFTLEGLVDLAIDLDKRVLYDRDKEKYYVLEDTIVYIYDPYAKAFTHTGKKQLGKLFIERGLINQEQLEIGLLYQQKFQRPIGASLVELGFIDELSLYSTLAYQSNIRFVPTDPQQDCANMQLLEVIGINKARLLEILPIGYKSDNIVVIACANPNNKGLKETCQNIFNKEVELVATQPSSIYRCLEKLDKPSTKVNEIADVNQLDQESIERFKQSYETGKFELELFLRASNLVGPTILSSMDPQESLLSSLVNKNYLLANHAHLINALTQAYQVLSATAKQQHHIPELVQIFLKANYLSEQDHQWVLEQSNRQGLSTETILISNAMIYPNTISETNALLKCLKQILT